MEWRVEHKPSYSLLKVFLKPGESVTAEAGAMVLIKGEVDIKTHTGGLSKAILRGLFGAESVFLNIFVARTSAEVWLAPRVPGDIEYIPLREESYVVQDMSYLAHHGDVDVGVAWRGLRGLLAEGELVWLKVEGVGGVWVNAYGGLTKIDLRPGERIIVDNFHFVAMNQYIRWRVRKFGGWKSFLLGGEGIVLEVEGPGTVYIQTRILPPLARLIRKYMPSSSGKNIGVSGFSIEL
ncbi:MAG: TIGR00266 family protein [Thermoprotei archaeon]|nr:MAG: TIGR00266 family protein [Thermoprotei archaeon]